jgi:hypothetical protein
VWKTSGLRLTKGYGTLSGNLYAKERTLHDTPNPDRPQVETPKTEDELVTRIRAHLAYVQDAVPPGVVPTQEQLGEGYNRVVEAAADVALTAFRYAMSELGATGFQASCAELEFMQRSRQLKGPFLLIDGEQLLYPQYNLEARVLETLVKWRQEWAPGEARRLIAENDPSRVNTQVWHHWQQLATSPSRGDE